MSTFESRSELGSTLAVSTFDNRELNIIVLVEFVLAILATETDVCQRILGTRSQSLEQWGIALLAGASLFVAWEIGKALVRLASRSRSRPASSAAGTVSTSGAAPHG